MGGRRRYTHPESLRLLRRCQAKLREHLEDHGHHPRPFFGGRRHHTSVIDIVLDDGLVLVGSHDIDVDGRCEDSETTVETAERTQARIPSWNWRMTTINSSGTSTRANSFYSRSRSTKPGLLTVDSVPTTAIIFSAPDVEAGGWQTTCRQWLVLAETRTAPLAGFVGLRHLVAETAGTHVRHNSAGVREKRYPMLLLELGRSASLSVLLGLSAVPPPRSTLLQGWCGTVRVRRTPPACRLSAALP